MKLLIDGSGGFAGDMFTAALINAGADSNTVKHNMEKCGSRLGRVQIESENNSDGSSKLAISLEAEHDHIGAGHIREKLKKSFNDIKTPPLYREFGINVLEILIEAENEAHKMNVFEKLMHEHKHHHHGTVLHEAQDIIIDIIGAVTGMELLGVLPDASLISPVRTGEGKVEFSHGILDVPAPATRVILDNYNIEWKKGPVDTELCTPTGASLLAALLKNNVKPDMGETKISGEGSSRGTKTLPIPPLKIYIV
ncbi:MAG: nickel insertion protein [Acidobacteriota bacterium]